MIIKGADASPEILNKIKFRDELHKIFNVEKHYFARLMGIFERKGELTVYEVKEERGRYGYKLGCLEADFKKCYEAVKKQKVENENYMTMLEITKRFGIQHAQILRTCSELEIPFIMKTKKIKMFDRNAIEVNSIHFEKGRVKEKKKKVNWIQEIYDLNDPYTRMFLQYNN